VVSRHGSAGALRCGLAIAALLAASLALGAAALPSDARAGSVPAGAGTPPNGPLAVSGPNHWIANWGHGTVNCPNYTDRPWVFWRTYGEARVGDSWLLDTSSRALCRGAVRMARSIAAREGQHLGATFDRTEEELYGSVSMLRGGTPRPLHPAPAGYSCYILPTTYELGFEQELAIFHQEETAWTQAVGISAGYVICLTHARLQGKQLHGAGYFTFGPDAPDCTLTYVIKMDRPDPDEPGAMMAPRINEAAIWGDYREGPCVAIPGAP
jgi:hypothetical protein